VDAPRAPSGLSVPRASWPTEPPARPAPWQSVAWPLPDRASEGSPSPRAYLQAYAGPPVRLFGADRFRFSDASTDVTLQAACTTLLYQSGSAKPLTLLNCLGKQTLTRAMVPRGGIEPPTLRFSVACSTN